MLEYLVLYGYLMATNHTPRPRARLGETQALTIRFPAEMYSELTRVAIADDRDIAHVVRKAVREHLTALGKDRASS